MDRKKKPEKKKKIKRISSSAKKQRIITSGKNKKKANAKEKNEPGILSFFENIFGQMPYAIAISDPKGYFLKANKAFTDLFRSTPRKEYGMFDDPVLRKSGFGKLLDKARKGKYAVIPELWFNIRDYYPDFPSYKICVKAIVYPVLNKKKIENFILIIENITEKKKIGLELQQSSERYKRIYENIQDVYYEASIDGKLVEISPSIETFTKFNRDELIGINIIDLYASPGEREIFLRELAIKGRVRNYLLNLKDKDGRVIVCSANSVLLFDEKNKPFRIIGSLNDISEHQKTVETLKRSEEKYREIFEGASELVWTSDLKGNVISVNPVVEKEMGYKVTEVVGMNIRQLFTEKSFREASEKIRFKVEHPDASSFYEIEAVAKNGEHLFYEVNSRLRYRDNMPQSIFGIARNITERKKAEEELNRTRERYTELFNASNDIIYTMDFKGNFTSVNPMAEKLLGYRFDEMGSPNMTQFITPETAKIAFDNIQAKLSGDKSSTIYEVEFLKKDGSYISLEINSQLRYENGRPVEIFGIARDVTLRKQAEEELNKTREKYMELFNSSNDIVYTMDFDGNFTSVNKTAEILLGLRFSDLADVNMRSYLTPESARRALADVVKKLRGQNENTVYEVDFIKKDGGIVTFEINSQVRYKNGEPFEVFGIARDVTERKKAIEALRNSEEKYRMIFENAPLGIMTADIRGNILEINPVLLQMLGSKSVQETKNINVLSFPPMVLAGLVEKFVKCIETGEPVISEHTYTSRWGKTLETRIYTKPIINPKGKIIGFQTIVEDITEQKENERQIRDALSEKEVLIREIHHRVKNNMQIIISLINMQMQDSTDVLMIKKFRELQQRVRSMSIIHEDLYMSDDLSRINFTSYLERLTNHLLQAYPNRSNLKLNIKVTDVLLGIDTAIPCGLIINELLSNAFKYAYPEDKYPAGKSCEINIEFASRNNHYQLIVSDNGIGLPPNVEDIKSKSLGLVLVEILVSQLKGTMKINNKKGVRFEIEIEKEKPKK